MPTPLYSLHFETSLMTTRDLKIKVLIPKKKIQLQNKGLGKKEANK